MALQCVHTTRLQGLKRVRIQWHCSHQENLYCCEEESTHTETSNHYKLFLKINISCVKQCKVICDALWMLQTKYFGLYVFFDYSCVFSISLAWIIRSVL
jgi:hypothetical protein